MSNVAVEVGGTQSFSFTDHDGKFCSIPKQFNGDIMTVKIHEPSQEELLALRVNWITPPMEPITPQSIWRSKRAVEAYNLFICLMCQERLMKRRLLSMIVNQQSLMLVKANELLENGNNFLFSIR